MTTNVPTIADVQADLASTFFALKNGEIEPKMVVELNNTAGKLISSYKIQLAYHALRGEAPTIPFLAAPVEGKAAALDGPSNAQ